MYPDYRESEGGKWRFNNPKQYRKTVEFQKLAASWGIAWHNPFSDECTIDFCCCQGDNILGSNYSKYFPSYAQAFKQLLEELYLECEHGDSEHRKWLKDKFNDFANRLGDD